MADRPIRVGIVGAGFAARLTGLVPRRLMVHDGSPGPGHRFFE